MKFKTDEKKHILGAFVLIIIYMITIYFSDMFSRMYNPKNYLSFHVLLEMFSIIISFAIVLLAWTIFKESLSRHRLYLGVLFLAVGLLDVLHTLTFNGMPFFFTESSIPLATWFWLLSRFTEAACLLAIFLIKDKPVTVAFRNVMFLFTFLYVVVAAIIVETQVNRLPLLVIEGQGTTTLKNSIEYFIIFLMVCTIVVLYKQYRENKQQALLHIITALQFLILSEFTFTLYLSVNDITNFLGHAYKVIGVYFLYKGIYVSTIEEPFRIRREAESALIESEERYRRLVDVSPDAIIVHYNNIILFCNQNFKDLVKEKRDLVGENVLNYVSEIDRPIVVSQVSKIHETKKYGPIERKYVTAQGDEVFVEVIAAPISYKGKNAVITNVRDITTRKKLERKIEESEKRYKSLFDHNQNASFVLDIHGHFIDINQAVEDLTGYSKEDIVGSSWILLIHKNKMEQTLKNFSKVMEGESANFETTVITKNGDDVVLLVNATPIIVLNEVIGIVGIAQDVTHKKMAEKELAESEERYRRLVELYPDGLFVHDQESFQYINDTTIRLLGAKTKQEIINKTILHFIREDQKAQVHYHIQMALKGSVDLSPKFEIELEKLTGENIIVEVGAVTIMYNGKPAILGSFRDITERKEAEEKLLQANKILKDFSNIDGLTGIYNRRFFDETLEKEWNRAVRNQNKLSFIMFDLDHFKAYNDTYGHHQGDICLKTVSNATKNSLKRATDFLARYGGEEFAVILPETDEVGALKAAEMIRSQIENLQIPHENSKVKPVVTVSVGVTTLIPSVDQAATDLIKKADEALYKAKNTGRNKVVVYDNQ